MKKQIIILSLLAATVAGSMTGCKKSSFDERYNNPEKTTNATIDGLFTGLQKNRRILPNYYNMFTFVMPEMAKYAGTAGFVVGNKMYVPSLNYDGDRWADFYTSPGDKWVAPIANYREMEKLYSAMSGEEAAGYKLLMDCGKVILFDQATQMVDLWGDIPFSKAGSLNTSGVISLASYDSQEAIYDSALTNLQAISESLASNTYTDFYKSKLAKQDMFLKGSIDGWRRYTNSLLLRLAMRISYKDEATAKTIVTKLLSDPTKYPLVETFDQNVAVPATSDMLSSDLAAGIATTPAPDYMINTLMVPSADPRLRVLFTKNVRGEYKGLPVGWSASAQNDSIANNAISRFDSTTFIRNDYFPGIVITAAETNFNIAEAYVRWGVGSIDAYEKGIRASISYYYKINSLSKYGSAATAATETEITTFLNSSLVKLGTDVNDNLEKIATQKWADLGIMLAPQAWAEVRRTGYPKLTFPTDASTATTQPPMRLLYPDSEKSLNAANYSAVASKDQLTTKLFWDVKD